MMHGNVLVLILTDVVARLSMFESSLVPRPTLAAADGLHHRYGGSGKLETIIGSAYDARF